MPRDPALRRDDNAYQSFVLVEFAANAQAFLEGLRTDLIALGVPAGNLTVSIPDTENFRVMLAGRRGARRANAYFELTMSPTGEAVLSLVADNGTVEIERNATLPVDCFIQAGLDVYRAKLTEATTPVTRGALLTKLRTALAV